MAVGATVATWETRLSVRLYAAAQLTRSMPCDCQLENHSDQSEKLIPTLGQHQVSPLVSDVQKYPSEQESEVPRSVL